MCCHPARAAVFRINLEFLTGWEERWKQTRWAKQFRATLGEMESQFSSFWLQKALWCSGLDRFRSWGEFHLSSDWATQPPGGDAGRQALPDSDSAHPKNYPKQMGWISLWRYLPLPGEGLDEVPSFLMTELGTSNPTLHFYWGRSFWPPSYFAHFEAKPCV